MQFQGSMNFLLGSMFFFSYDSWYMHGYPILWTINVVIGKTSTNDATTVDPTSTIYEVCFPSSFTNFT